MTDDAGARSGGGQDPEDRVPDPEQELLHGARWFAGDLLRCLMAAALIAFGFFVVASVGPWPWPGIAVAFVAVATVAAAIVLRSSLWITVVVAGFVLLNAAPRWLVPTPDLTGGPFPLTVENQSGWITAAMVAGLTSWLAITAVERALAARRAVQRWSRDRDR
jgi:hypothetical protein